ncbi:hypothetical protein OG884_15410 [Streptosporangium sp. NBC_01755]|nr:hypothetical protein [Streptosporangium sp. NBC_01755]WSD03221.1 hypothetical protein OG884_15410 [Streptosporangium sp. NBC_01755]
MGKDKNEPVVIKSSDGRIRAVFAGGVGKIHEGGVFHEDFTFTDSDDD